MNNTTNYDLSQNPAFLSSLIVVGSVAGAATVLGIHNQIKLIRYKLIDTGTKIILSVMLVSIVLMTVRVTLENFVYFILAMVGKFEVLEVHNMKRCQIIASIKVLPGLVTLVIPVPLTYNRWRCVRLMDVSDDVKRAVKASIVTVVLAILVTIMLAASPTDVTYLPMCDTSLVTKPSTGIVSSSVYILTNGAALGFVALFPGIVVQSLSFLALMIMYIAAVTTPLIHDKVELSVFNIYCVSGSFCVGTLAMCISLRQLFRKQEAAVEPDVSQDEQAYRLNKLSEQWMTAAKAKGVKS